MIKIVVQVKVTGVKGVVRSMGKLVEWANIKTPAVTFDAAERGKEKAVQLAPKDTKDLINAIGVAESRGKGFSVVSRVPKGQNKRKRKYHMFMHGLEGYNTGNMIRTGDPRYMFTMYQWLRKEYPKKMQESLDKAIRK